MLIKFYNKKNMEMDLEDSSSSSSSSHISDFDARRAKKFKISHSGELPEIEANNSIEIEDEDEDEGEDEDEDDYDFEWQVFTTNGYRDRRRIKYKNTRAKVRDGEIIKFDSGDIKHIPNSPSVSDCTEIMKVLSTDNNFALKFCCIKESSICVPKLLGSKAIETPVPKTPVEE